MYKLILLFRRPDDPERFEDRWSHEFVPLVEEMPGLQRVAVCRVDGSLSEGSHVYLLHELFFEDRGSLEAAMASPTGQRAGQLLMEIAGSDVQLLFAQHLEDSPQPRRDRA